MKKLFESILKCKRRGQMTLPGAFMWMVMLFGLAVTTDLRDTMYSTAIIQVGNSSTSAMIISAIEPILWIGAIMSFLLYVLPSRETGGGVY